MSLMEINKKKESKANASFDRKRMVIALQSPKRYLPKGLSPEDIRDYILKNR